ncbi:hypothetical protein ACFVAD_19270 [Sutcliffiella sp. NPDC057660]|uniref:hypothetical protein n=1 Tax=Sutcliffiella sp. NPDC057660 TaxID=3346199 RepID=UPI0036A323A6
MVSFLEQLLVYTDILFFGVFLACGYYFLSHKKKLAMGLIFIVVAIGGAILVYQLKYTTFDEWNAEYFGAETTIRSISIHVNETTDEFPEELGRITIEDKEEIDRVLADLKGLKLKKVTDTGEPWKKYEVEFLVVNEKGNLLETNRLSYAVDQYYINDYQIISEQNHLSTIEELVESEEMEWKDNGKEKYKKR